MPKRLLAGYEGILLTDGYEAYAATASAAACPTLDASPIYGESSKTRAKRRTGRAPLARRSITSADCIESNGRCVISAPTL